MQKKWQTPGHGLVKINCEGAWDKASNEAGTGVIVRDEEGHMIRGTGQSTMTSSAEVAEAMAVLEGG